MVPRYHLLLSFLLVVACDEIPTTRTYDLQVPGSDPIRIIEAEPLWERQHFMDTTTTEVPSWNGLEHRALKPTTDFITKTHNQEYEDEQDEPERDSSEELEKFLKGYAEKLRRTTTTELPSEHFHKIELITKPSTNDEPTNRLASLFLNTHDGKDELTLEQKMKGWNLLNVHRHKHPYDDKNGWVSLEVAPWSVSKVSKWHSNIVKQNSGASDAYGAASMTKPIWSYKPMVTYQPGTTSSYNKPNPRPAFTPSTTYAQKVYIQNPDYSDEIPIPWHKNPNTNPYQNTHKVDTDPDCETPGIITDGLPPNFPKPHHEYVRRKGGDDDQHPATYPVNGDVLPPLKDSKINMTTSHGGLLQVESTFQTVDEAQKIYRKKQNMKRRPAKRKPVVLNKPVRQTVAVSNVNAAQKQPAINTRRRLPSASTVLAAVGAGMIPATMAMLVPMAMGKRRRKREIVLDLKPLQFIY